MSFLDIYQVLTAKLVGNVCLCNRNVTRWLKSLSFSFLC